MALQQHKVSVGGQRLVCTCQTTADVTDYVLQCSYEHIPAGDTCRGAKHTTHRHQGGGTDRCCKSLQATGCTLGASPC